MPPTPSTRDDPADRRADAEELARQIQVGGDGRITLHMDDLDIRRALELLSREGGLNIMVSPGVSGRVTAHLEQATIEQTLSAILRLGNLTARRENGLIYVYTAQDLKQQTTYDQAIATRVYRLNYIRASDLMTMIEKLLSTDGTMTSTPESNEGINDSPTFSTGGGGGGGGGGAVAPSSGGGGGGGGKGQGTSGGNSMSGGDVVVVRDYENHLRTVDEIVKKLDVQPEQVLVEAVIVSVELTRGRELGINYSAVDDLGTSLGTVGNGAELAANSGFTPAKLITVPAAGADAAARAASGRINGGAATGGFNSTTNGIKFGFVSDNNSGFLRALETMGETRVLASPRLLVLNKQKAEIQLGQRLGYSTVTQNFTSTVQQVQFLNTGTLLRLRPFISSDGMIRMEIHPERSSGSIGLNNLPNSNTAEVTTNVMIPDGKTLVIGGLIENQDDFNYQGLPGINKLPVLGAAFGFRNRNKAKRELIVMLTPHIMNSCAPPPGTGGNIPEELSSPGTTPARDASPPSLSPEPFPAPALPEPPTPRAEPGLEALPPELRDLAPAVPREVSGQFIRPASQAVAAKNPPARRHRVAGGENYWTISRLHYGTGIYYLALWYHNHRPGDRPENLNIGDDLRIPPPEELERSLVVDARTNRLLDGSSVDVMVDRIQAREVVKDGEIARASLGVARPAPDAARGREVPRGPAPPARPPIPAAKPSPAAPRKGPFKALRGWGDGASARGAR